MEEVRKAAGNNAAHAFDAISEKGSITALGRALAKGSKIATVLTPEMMLSGTEDPSDCEVLFTMVGTVHQNPAPGTKFGDREFGAVFFSFSSQGLAEGWFRGHLYEVVEGGLDGLQKPLRLLEEGKLSAKKLVLRLADTEGTI